VCGMIGEAAAAGGSTIAKRLRTPTAAQHCSCGPSADASMRVRCALGRPVGAGQRSAGAREPRRWSRSASSSSSRHAEAVRRRQPTLRPPGSATAAAVPAAAHGQFRAGWQVPVRETQFVVDEYLAMVRRRPVGIQFSQARAAAASAVTPVGEEEQTLVVTHVRSAELKRAFDRMDTDRSGSLDLAEIRQLLVKQAQGQGVQTSDEQLDVAMAELDLIDGLVSYEEFETYWRRLELRSGISIPSPLEGEASDSDSGSDSSSDSDSDSDSDSSDSDSEPGVARGCVDESAAAAPPKAKDSTIEVAYDPRVTQTRALFKQLDIDSSGFIESAEMALLARLLGAQDAFLEPFSTKTHLFSKTGSGQT
jgi:hypothetical protein